MFDLDPDRDKATITYGERSPRGIDYFELVSGEGAS